MCKNRYFECISLKEGKFKGWSKFFETGKAYKELVKIDKKHSILDHGRSDNFGIKVEIKRFKKV